MTRSAFLASLMVAHAAFAQAVPTKVNFTARLVDAGAPVQGNRDFVFKLFPTVVGGTEVWSEVRNAVPVIDGAVNLDLGASTALTDTIFDGQTLYLEVTVGTQVLSPRTAVMSVPYALRSTVAAQVGTLTPAQIQRRVTSACGAGAAIQTINADGTVVCQAVGANDAGVTTITNITAGAGLTGGGSTGNVTLATAPTVQNWATQPSCAVGSYVRAIAANGTVTCSPETGGTVTSVTTGSGLTGGPITTTGTIGLAATVQNWSTQPTCGVGSYVRAIAANGAVTCATDSNSGGTVTSVSTGAGLTGGPITGAGTIGLAATVQNWSIQPNCGAGSYVQSISSTGTVSCGTDTNSGGTVTSISTGAGLTGGPISTTGTIGLASTVQNWPTQPNCTGNTVMKGIAANGTVNCVPDGNGVSSVTLNPFGAAAVAFTDADWRIEVSPSPYAVQVNHVNANFISYSIDNGDGAPVSGISTASGTFGKAVLNAGRIVRVDVSTNNAAPGSWYHYECRNAYSSIFQCTRQVY